MNNNNIDDSVLKTIGIENAIADLVRLGEDGRHPRPYDDLERRRVAECILNLYRSMTINFGEDQINWLRRINPYLWFE